MIEINVTEKETVTLVEVSGRVDSMNANQFGDALNGQIDGGRVHIVLDLSSVEYRSSAGLREIVTTLKAAAASVTECPTVKQVMIAIMIFRRRTAMSSAARKRR